MPAILQTPNFTASKRKSPKWKSCKSAEDRIELTRKLSHYITFVAPILKSCLWAFAGNHPKSIENRSLIADSDWREPTQCCCCGRGPLPHVSWHVVTPDVTIYTEYKYWLTLDTGRRKLPSLWHWYTDTLPAPNNKLYTDFTGDTQLYNPLPGSEYNQ